MTARIPNEFELPGEAQGQGPAEGENRMDSGFFDMQTAKSIQQALLPKQPPEIPGYKMGFYYAPRKSVGGDYCDFITIDKKNVAIAIADVSGHGVSGAIVAAQMRTFIHSEIERRVSPRELMLRLNKMLYDSTPANVYATMVYMHLEIRKRRVTYVNAGHPPIALKRWKDSRLELLEHMSVPVGADPGPRFKEKLIERKIPLEAGDLLVAYTDGITEAVNPYGEPFAQNFYKLLLEHASRPWQEMSWFIMGALHAYTRKEKQDDDITLVSLRATKE